MMVTYLPHDRSKAVTSRKVDVTRAFTSEPVQVHRQLGLGTPAVVRGQTEVPAGLRPRPLGATEERLGASVAGRQQAVEAPAVKCCD